MSKRKKSSAKARVKSIAPNIEGLAGMLSAVLAQTTNIQAADSAVDGKANNLMAAALVIIALLGTQLYDSGHHLHTFAIASISNTPAILPSGRPVPQPNKTEPYRKGL